MTKDFLNISLGASLSLDVPQLRIFGLTLYRILIGLIDYLESYFLSTLHIRCWPSIRCSMSKDLFPICWLLFCPIDSAF